MIKREKTHRALSALSLFASAMPVGNERIRYALVSFRLAAKNARNAEEEIGVQAACGLVPRGSIAAGAAGSIR